MILLASDLTTVEKRTLSPDLGLLCNYPPPPISLADVASHPPKFVIRYMDSLPMCIPSPVEFICVTEISRQDFSFYGRLLQCGGGASGSLPSSAVHQQRAVCSGAAAVVV